MSATIAEAWEEVSFGFVLETNLACFGADGAYFFLYLLSHVLAFLFHELRCYLRHNQELLLILGIFTIPLPSVMLVRRLLTQVAHIARALHVIVGEQLIMTFGEDVVEGCLERSVFNLDSCQLGDVRVDSHDHKLLNQVVSLPGYSR